MRGASVSLALSRVKAILKDFGSDGDVNLQNHSILSPALRSEGGWWNRRVAGLAGQVYMLTAAPRNQNIS
jgi:hypothetical protein